MVDVNSQHGMVIINISVKKLLIFSSDKTLALKLDPTGYQTEMKSSFHHLLYVLMIVGFPECKRKRKNIKKYLVVGSCLKCSISV
jgi:hypothetical protein